MSILENIDLNKTPDHVAIIMDGNGRWAQNQGHERLFGHNLGVESVRETLKAAQETNIKYLTLYAFSTENWNRSEREVNALMTLLISTISKETKTLMKNDICLNTIGKLSQLPKKCKQELEQAVEKTKNNKRMTLILALSYSGRWEIVNAVNKIIHDSKNNLAKEITEDTFQQYLNTKGVPDPELLIRTSGEHRISNFLLWQIAYSELYFTDTLWPDFRKEDLIKAIIDYQKRERRFGKTKAQIK